MDLQQSNKKVQLCKHAWQRKWHEWLRLCHILFSIPLQYFTLSFRNCRSRRAHVPDYAYVLQGLFVFQFLDLLLGDKEI